MYQALYRKYRPSNFNDVIGQEIIIRTLQNAVVNNKISHAYLFAGPRGTGKTSIAKIMAKTVNCLDQKNGIPCCKCVNCTQIENKQSTDVIEIDAASNNGVDEIREIRNKVNLVPTTGKYKVYIIDEVHMLTTGAFNALLKTLEEPPAHIIFILATTEPHKIPATILSRCQRFDFKKIPEKQIIDRLKDIKNKENIDISDEALSAIAQLSDGGMRDSINLLDQVASYANDKIELEDIYRVNGTLSEQSKIEFVEKVMNNDLIKLLEMLNNYNEEGKNLVKVIEEIAETLKNILLLKLTPEYAKNIIYDVKIYDKLLDKMDVDKVINLINEINNNLNSIKQSNDPKLAIELLLIKNNYSTKNISQNFEIDKTIQNEEKKQKIEPKKEEIKEEQEETKQQEVKSLEEEIDFNHIQERRIENTLAHFQKKNYLEIKKELAKLEEYVTDKKYAKLISLLLDGALKAASEEYLLYVYKTKGMSNDFNSQIIDIEEMLEKILKKKYKVIATDNISWEIIKKDFNSKEKEYLYIPEDFDLKKLMSTNENNALSEYFENLIEYE